VDPRLRGDEGRGWELDDADGSEPPAVWKRLPAATRWVVLQ